MNQKVLVSIDVEAPEGLNGINNLIYGNIRGKEYGINCLMDILDSFEIKGLFFVDIAEAWEYNSKDIKGVINTINSRGHNVGVHIHPDRMKDRQRRFLWQYSYNEQKEIIEKCTNFYTDTMGKSPISFRAGRYGANNDTIELLSYFGYKIDMSVFYGMNKRCKVDHPYLTVNRVIRSNNIIEVPVTAFKSFDMFGYKRFDKIDESMPLEELKLVCQEIEKSNSVDVISFFMHSFSLLNWRSKPESPQYSDNNYTRIRKMLKYLKNTKKYLFLTENDILKTNFRYKNDFSILDTSNKIESLLFSIKRARKIVLEKMINNI